MNLLVEHAQEALAEQADLLPGRYLDTPIVLPRKAKHRLQAWLLDQGYGNIAFWDPVDGGYRLSLHSQHRRILPLIQKAADKLARRTP